MNKFGVCVLATPGFHKVKKSLDKYEEIMRKFKYYMGLTVHFTGNNCATGTQPLLYTWIKQHRQALQ